MKLRIKRNKDRSLLACIVVAALLCLGQVLGSTPVLLACLLAFLLVVAVAAYRGKASPVLLFFLPWAPLLKLAPGTFSFYTFALIMVCGIALWRRQKTLNFSCVLIGMLVLALTLVAKLIHGYGLSASYMLFMFLLLLFPMVMEEVRERVSFTTLTIFFSMGIICAGLSAQQLVKFSRIARYIDVFSWSVITRYSGYYGDANFYSAHISAALGGVLTIFLREEKGRTRNMMPVLALPLLYCGFLSASKTFFLVLACMLVFWLLDFLFMRGKILRKLLIFASIVAVIVAVAASGLFADQWRVIVYRFNQATSLSSLTTGRTDLWMDYLRAFRDDAKLLILGKGMTNVLVGGKASHNTILQVIFQFGVIGGLALAVWEFFYIRGTMQNRKAKVRFLEAAVLMTGAFLPWMSLDLLFFDEFFLMPLYVAAGFLYAQRDSARRPARLSENADAVPAAQKNMENPSDLSEERS